MSSAHGPAILSGSADKKPHGTFGRLLHDHEKRYFVLRMGAGGVPELAYVTPPFYSFQLPSFIIFM
jgi:hypothetical protein